MRIRRLLPVAAAILSIATTLHAQTAVQIFLDRARSEKERLAAVPRIGWPEKATAERLLAAGADRSESDAIRLEALKKHPLTEPWLELVLRILNDPNDGGPLLDSELLEFLNRRMIARLPAELRQRIQATWRRLLDDPRDAVRLSAFRVGAANHDPAAVNRLSEGLRTRSGPPIPLHEAIELLDLNGATSHLGALRPFLQHRDPVVAARAARALAVDAESRPLIVRLASNPQTPEEVRIHALRGLAREDARFGSYAIPLIDNREEDGDVRFAAMHSYAGRLNYNRTPEEEQIRFAQAVERIAGDQGLRSAAASRIRTEARKLLEYLKRAFPGVGRFYANR